MKRIFAVATRAKPAANRATTMRSIRRSLGHQVEHAGLVEYRSRTAKVELKPFERTITVPGIVVERPGWSTIEITAPMTGIVTRIYPIQGEAIEPEQSLFEVRLTHEDLLQSQTEFLRTVEELDVIGREVARLEKVSADGVIAGKSLLERKYEQQKQEAALRAQRQALLLHGLSKDQVDNIASTRTLLQSLTIRAPVREEAAKAHPLHVQELKVSQGKYVSAGDTLCKLADYGELYIEGQAFEQDIGVINKAASSGCGVSAILGSKSAGGEEVSPGLCILYLDDKVDPESRAFHFYVALPNRILREDKAEGRCFVYWQFRPGPENPESAYRWSNGRTGSCFPSKPWPKRGPRLTSSGPTTIISTGGRSASSTAIRIGS